MKYESFAIHAWNFIRNNNNISNRVGFASPARPCPPNVSGIDASEFPRLFGELGEYYDF